MPPNDVFFNLIWAFVSTVDNTWWEDGKHGWIKSHSNILEAFSEEKLTFWFN